MALELVWLEPLLDRWGAWKSAEANGLTGREDGIDGMT